MRDAGSGARGPDAFLTLINLGGTAGFLLAVSAAVIISPDNALPGRRVVISMAFFAPFAIAGLAFCVSARNWSWAWPRERWLGWIAAYLVPYGIFFGCALTTLSSGRLLWEFDQGHWIAAAFTGLVMAVWMSLLTIRPRRRA